MKFSEVFEALKTGKKNQIKTLERLLVFRKRKGYDAL